MTYGVFEFPCLDLRGWLVAALSNMAIDMENTKCDTIYQKDERSESVVRLDTAHVTWDSLAQASTCLHRSP